MINLKSFLIAHKLDPKKTAQELFPDNGYPVMAMKRILDGEALLDSSQITRLAAFAGVPVSKVFNNGWSVATDFVSSSPKYVLTSDTWRAEIDRSTWVTQLFLNDELVHEQVISSPTATLSDLIQSLELVIAKADFR